MIVTHIKPVGWVDTEEDGVIQPSEVAELVHLVTLEPEDIELLRGPAGPAGIDGEPGVAGAAGAVGPQGPVGAVGKMPAGAVSFFATAAAPAGWLICNGQTILRADYAALFAAIGTMYGAGDGLTNFKVPDLRGEFLRGADLGRGVDPARALGSGQDSDNKSHRHGLHHSNSGLTAQSPWDAIYVTKAQNVGLALSEGIVSVDLSGGLESRPRNIAMLPCICAG
ncbi:hypothetical protein AT959_05055 [Dechloromonas denitrificans]|uniref:Phage tail collar domain-containing protein n=1 Tax=Dechloromonas denitrificans TaxID=281362 RepID=A0A133XLD8_9RHOO|nr:tail fiber protein [Dechloromonas denitrificans]KXB31727.1 hypothetical protein AT959_05055 [Dechloromonas denitrificans]